MKSLLLETHKSICQHFFYFFKIHSYSNEIKITNEQQKKKKKHAELIKQLE